MHVDVAYKLVDTPEGFARVAAALAAGRGPLAIDTERASAYRYDDRAFLVQIHRRGAGTFLIAPEGHREVVRDALAPVVNGADWILHAASEDLTALALLGLHPGRLFDTELAARLAGFDRPNLGAMVQHFTGVQLEKGHGQEDWSLTPLPAEWLEYAALDVVYLNDLAEALTEVLDGQGLLDAAEEEFAHLVATRSQAAPTCKTWRDVKGIGALRTRAGLQLARELWATRDEQARRRDLSPSRVLPTNTLVEVAKAAPSSPRELARVRGFPARRRGAAEEWFGHIQCALAAPQGTWPEPLRRDATTPPKKSAWERIHPESWAVLTRCRELVAEAGHGMGVRPEDLLPPAVLREVVWRAAEELDAAAAPRRGRAPWDTDSVARRLSSAGARPWQVGIAAPLIARAYSEEAEG